MQELNFSAMRKEPVKVGFFAIHSSHGPDDRQNHSAHSRDRDAGQHSCGCKTQQLDVNVSVHKAHAAGQSSESTPSCIPANLAHYQYCTYKHRLGKPSVNRGLDTVNVKP